MDYRKAWDEVKAKLEASVQEGRDNGYDDAEANTRESGMYEAFERVLDHVKELESKIPNVIKVGDTVRVLNNEFWYPNYSDWIHDNIDNPFLVAKWGRNRRLNTNAIGVVKVIAPHGYEDRDLAYIEVGNVCFIVALEGLEKI